MLKSFEQQRIEQEHGGKDIKEIITTELKRLCGKPYLMAQAAVGFMISEPTLRKWCEDMDIKIKDYQ